MDNDDLSAVQSRYERGYRRYLRWLEFLLIKYLVTPSNLDESDEDFKSPT